MKRSTTQLWQTALAAIAIFALSTNVLSAGTWTWVGSSNGDWTLASNWNPATVPDNDGTATIWLTNCVGVIDLDGDWDIDTLYIGGDDAMDMTLGNTDDTLTIRSLIYRHRYDPSWPYHAGDNQFNCKIAIGADGVVFYNDYGASYKYINTFTDNGNAYDWTIIGGFDIRDSGTTDQPSPFSGTMFLKSGALYVRGDHAFTNAAALFLEGIGNFSTSDGVSKIGSSVPVNMYGGTLTTTFAGTEDIGDLILGGGLSALFIRNSSTLQADQLLRGTTSLYMPALCSLQTVDAVNQFVKLDDTSSLELIGGDGSRTTNKKIVPYLFYYNGTTDAFRTLYTYDASTGLTPLDITTEFVHATDTNFPVVNSDGNDNVLLVKSEAGGTTLVLTNDVTVNSLVYYHDSDSTVTFDLQGYTLTINSGVLIANNDLSGNNDNIQIINGTIDVGTASEFILYSSMGGNYPCFSLKNGLILTGAEDIIVHNSRDDTTFQNVGTNVTSMTLNNCANICYVGDGCVATNAVVTGILDGGYSDRNNIIRNNTFNSTVHFGELHGMLNIKSGHSNQGGNEEVVIGDTTEGHVDNHIRLMANGVISPNHVTISSSDATQFDGGIIGLSAFDTNYSPGQEFTVDFHDGQVVIDLFGPDNYDQIQVQLSEGGQANVSMSDGTHPGSELVVRLHAVPDINDSFTIVQVEGTSAISGKFSNGDIVKATYGEKTYAFDISYDGDSGNDIVLSNGSLVSQGTLIIIK